MTNEHDSRLEIIANMLHPQSEVDNVDARSLHKALGIQKDFSNWIKAQFNRGGFEEGVDYWEVFEQTLFAQKGEKSDSDFSPFWAKTGRPTRDYLLTNSTAKHIAMMANTEAGKLVRDYFIARDKKLRIREEEDARLLLEYAERLESESKLLAKEIGSVVDREFDRFDISVTQLSKCIGALLYEITGEEENVFTPTAHDINVIMWKMGLIGTRTDRFGVKKPNPYSVLTKFFADYPGVAVPKFFSNKENHNPELCYEAVKLNTGAEAFGDFIVSLKTYGIKNNIGIKK